MAHYIEPPNGFTTVETAWIPMDDGVRLAAKLWLPDQAKFGRVPAVIEAHPYRRRDRSRPMDQMMHGYLAAHGIAGVRVDIRGSGDSDGLPLDEYLPREQLDLVAAVQWAADQPWCDGNVALIGISWGAFAALQAAARRPPALRSVIAVGATDDRYATDVHYENGALLTLSPWWAGMMFAYNALPPDPAVRSDDWRSTWLTRLESNRPWISQWLAHNPRDAYWRQGSICEDYGAIEVPVLAISGWADLYAQAIPRLVHGLAGRIAAVIGPWDHAYPHMATVGEPVGFLQQALTWLSATLRPDGAVTHAPLTAWVPALGAGDGAWVSVSHQALAAQAHLRMETAAVDAAIRTPLGAAALDLGTFVAPLGTIDSPADVLGAAAVNLAFAADGAAALLALDLIATPPGGPPCVIAGAVHNLAHRESRSAPSPLEPGHVYEVSVALNPAAATLPAGTTLGLAIRSNDFPHVWPARPPGSFRVVGTIAVEVPLVPASATRVGTPFDPPEMLRPTPFTWKRRPASLAPVTRRENGRVVTTLPTDSGERTLDDIDGCIVVTEGETRVEANETDPYSVSVTSDITARWRRGDLELCTQAKMAVTGDAEHFRIKGDLAATENGREAFRRVFDEFVLRPATL